jgi:hypothetical protein
VGWTKQGNQNVNILNGQTTRAQGVYQQALGSLTVTIQPQDVLAKGAQWRVNGGSWQNSGVTVSNFTTGNHVVEFKEMAGWTKPGQIPVTITTGQTSQSMGVYKK